MDYNKRFLGYFDRKSGIFSFHPKKVRINVLDDIEIILIGKITGFYGAPLISLKNQISLIRKLFSEQKEKFITKLEGYFLIIIYDKNEKTLYIFNNRYSNTYCYYYLSKNKIIFSDEIKTILEKTENNKKLNYDVIDLFLNSGYSFSNKTNFCGIYRMVPGFYLKANKEGITHVKYSKMVFKRKPLTDINKSLKDYERIWIEELKNYIKANNIKSLACTLSGGLDTSWLVLMASKAFRKPLNVYTCKFEYDLFDETNAAKFVAKKTNSVYHEIYVDEKDLDLLPEMIRITEEPVLSTSLPIFKLMIEASKKNDAILTGDGGNNIFHHLYPVGEIHKYIHFMPYGLRKLFFILANTLSRVTGSNRLWELRYALHPFSFRDFYDNFYKNLVCYRHFDFSQRKKLLKPEFYDNFQEENNLGKIPIRKETFDDDLIHARFVHGNMEYVSTYHDKIAKEYGMIFFPPYQNQRIMDFICSLPMNMLFRGNTLQKLTNKANKMYFVKQGLKRHLPEDFVDKTGAPFDQPYHAWLEKRPEVVRLLFKRLLKRGWYKKEFLEKLYKEHKKQKQHDKEYCYLANHGYRIMLLLSLEIWCTEFIDKKSGMSKKQRVPLEEYLSASIK